MDYFLFNFSGVQFHYTMSQSNHYDESNSLASTQYKYTKDMLMTDLGKLHIIDDIEK